MTMKKFEEWWKDEGESSHVSLKQISKFAWECAILEMIVEIKSNTPESDGTNWDDEAVANFSAHIVDELEWSLS